MHNKGDKGQRFCSFLFIFIFSDFKLSSMDFLYFIWFWWQYLNIYVLFISPYLSYLSQFSLKKKKKKKRVTADSHLIMLSNIVMRQMSPRRDCTAERFLRVLLEISGRNKSRNWGSGDSHHHGWHTYLVVGNQMGSLILTSHILFSKQKVLKWLKNLLQKIYFSIV